MGVTSKILARGDALALFELLRDGKSLVRGFVTKELDRARRDRIFKLLQRIADCGPPKDPRKFAHEVDGIFAIKDFQVRIYCFFEGGKRLFLTHDAVKKTDKADPEDLKRAKTLRDEYGQAARN